VFGGTCCLHVQVRAKYFTASPSQKAAFFILTVAINLSVIYLSSVRMLVCAISEDSNSFERVFIPKLEAGSSPEVLVHNTKVHCVASQRRAEICCWFSPAESFLVLAPSEPMLIFFLLSKKFSCLKIGTLFDVKRGWSFCDYSEQRSIAVTPQNTVILLFILPCCQHRKLSSASCLNKYTVT
jgi:hypothetical protein